MSKRPPRTTLAPTCIARGSAGGCRSGVAACLTGRQAHAACGANINTMRHEREIRFSMNMDQLQTWAQAQLQVAPHHAEPHTSAPGRATGRCPPTASSTSSAPTAPRQRKSCGGWVEGKQLPKSGQVKAGRDARARPLCPSSRPTHTSQAAVARPPRSSSGASQLGLVAPPPAVWLTA